MPIGWVAKFYVRYLYATCRSFAQYGTKPSLKALRAIYQRGYEDAARKGFTGCDHPAVQSVASSSNENWATEPADWQKGRNPMSLTRPRRSVLWSIRRPTDEGMAILP